MGNISLNCKFGIADGIQGTSEHIPICASGHEPLPPTCFGDEVANAAFEIPNLRPVSRKHCVYSFPPFSFLCASS